MGTKRGASISTRRGFTAQKITGFFGRLPPKKRRVEKAGKERDNDDTDSAAKAEAYHSSLHSLLLIVTKDRGNSASDTRSNNASMSDVPRFFAMNRSVN